ncbi:MAG: bifunctional serine/threonine-protein kinase/formylglycine-generating enzyme family protein [Planctomycetota bacterium]
MTQDRHERLRILFHAAIEIDRSDRAAFLELVCSEDTQLRADLEKLLNEDEDAGQLAQTSRLEAPESPSPEDSKEPLVLASTHYLREGELARGGMGLVFRVWDRDLERPLAMKVVRDRKPGGKKDRLDSGLLLRFVEEARITGQLDHPGVVPVHQIGVDDEQRPFFTMRLVKGRTFERVFELAHRDSDGWTTTRVLGVFVKVCETLAYAHSMGVIHRDVKPRNVMVGSFGETYVMDWGVAKILGTEDTATERSNERASSEGDASNRSDHDTTLSERRRQSPLVTAAGTVIGTPCYMPPEQAEGRLDELNERADVYAVGAMLYEFLSGQTPYHDSGKTSTPQELLHAVRDGPPTSLESDDRSIPHELVAICEKAMSRKPDDRYASCLQLRDDLQAYLDGRVVRAYRTGAIAELRAWTTRNRGMGASIVGAVIALCIGLLLFLFQKNVAETRLDEIRRLADTKRLGELSTEAANLWPCRPEKVSAMEDWLSKAEALYARRSMHRASLDELRRRRAAKLVAAPEGDETWRFRDTEDQWQHDTLVQLVEGLGDLGTTESSEGLIASVRGRLERAKTIRARSIETPRDDWNRAIASIANSKECPAYRGLRLSPQIGLVPIGRDPDSGLWEFVHLETGDAPSRDENGRLLLTETTGLVLVLLPKGSFRMGAVKPSEETPRGTPNVDPYAFSNEAPVREVALDAFFLSKYEMTQEQWARLEGRNPSAFRVGGKKYVAKHPVEQVSWNLCSEVVWRVGLTLPTEAQWEYGTRGGTSSVWWTGDERGQLEGAANLADQAAARAGAHWSDIQDWPELDDGFAVHAPVGSFRANPFGLHDVHGNVWEWCRDWHASYELPVASGDGERIVTSTKVQRRAIRGGGFVYAAYKSRSALRREAGIDFRSNDVGLRPARPVDRASD